MPLSIQVKLLRVLQDGTFSRVGSNETISSDARIITATHKDLAAEVAAGRFREDLYYRLNVVDVRIPPLRDRKEDIPLLAEYFLQRITHKNGMARIRLSQEAVTALQSYQWPGNVRELENTIARACALASSSVLLPGDIPLASSPILSKFKIDDAIDRIIHSAPSGNVIPWVISQLAQRTVAMADNDLKQAAINLGISQEELKKLLAP